MEEEREKRAEERKRDHESIINYTSIKNLFMNSSSVCRDLCMYTLYKQTIDTSSMYCCTLTGGPPPPPPPPALGGTGGTSVGVSAGDGGRG